MKIYLVRHTESKAQTEEEFSLDANLSQFGEQQAKQLRQRLAQIQFDVTFLSPLKRARQTFELSEVDCKDIYFDSRLAEELPPGMYADNILPYETTPSYAAVDIYNSWEVPILDRLKLFWQTVYALAEESTVLIVCHAGVLNWLLGLFLNPNMSDRDILNRPKCFMANGALSVIEVNSDTQNQLLTWNETEHLNLT